MMMKHNCKKTRMGCPNAKMMGRNRDVARNKSSMHASCSNARIQGSNMGGSSRQELAIMRLRRAHYGNEGRKRPNREFMSTRLYSKEQDSLEDQPDIDEEYVPASSYRNNKSNNARASPMNSRSKLDNSTPQIRMRHAVQYRCHSRQMLAIAGSMSPLGWSFLSIARNPMSWREGDSWNIELDFPAGARIEYKYVVLEDQDWTKQADEAAEGLVPLYRPSGKVLEPDTAAIVRQMAIVAWQPGPNLVYTVPSEDEAKKSGLTSSTESGAEIPLVERIDIWK